MQQHPGDGRQAGKQRLAGDLARGRVQRGEQDELGAGQGTAVPALTGADDRLQRAAALLKTEVGKRRQVQPQELFPVVVQHHLADSAAVAQQAIKILAGKGRQSSAAGPYRHFRRKAGEQRLGLRFGGGEGKIHRQPDDFLQGGIDDGDALPQGPVQRGLRR